ncbi:hypothetical protein ES707_12312 [subsurface metagenome]
MKLRSVLSVIDNMSEWSGKTVAWLLVPIIIVLLYETTGRYAFDSPTMWAHETTQMLFGAMFILGIAWVHRHGEHVNMDIIFDRFPVRMQGIVDMFTSIFFFIICVAMVLKGGELAWVSLLNLERSFTPWHPPIYPLKLVIPIAGLLLLLQGVAKFIRDFNKATKGVELI